ncbi:signal recognition particle subunit SRP19/SEC65 family protein [Methanobrevibacter sp. DSM 116169]|uniref:signal recognition particle subunit SRP19/SEC65 family protein n=1 Tax=Methanobrevibacter sp. DSM 116169 TaxID=3242727 RepID=UPI0038FCD93F
MTIIWPEYFNEELSLNEGRKVSKEKAIKNPTVKDIEKALKRLQVQYTIEKEKSYPGKWYVKSGMVIAETDKKKTELLKEISEKIRK